MPKGIWATEAVNALTYQWVLSDNEPCVKALKE